MSEEITSLLSRQEYELQEYTVDGQIVTLKPADQGQLGEKISLVIDDQPFTCERVVLARDAFGQPKVDRDNNAVYRYTTVHDAIDRFYVRTPHDINPVPILCHQEHLEPVAMCRACMVFVQGPEFDRNGKPKRDDEGNIVYGRESMVPSCHRIVDNNMRIYTPRCTQKNFKDKLSKVSKTVVELLMADHGNPRAHVDLAELPAEERKQRPELYQLARRLEVPSTPRFPKASKYAERGHDSSSMMIEVDHTSCILCDRCIRSCTDVKKNYVIGRTGHGYQTRISFDLDEPMGSSSCVSCGECAINCPTDALTIKVVNPREQAEGQTLSVNDLVSHPLLQNLSPKYLKFLEKSFVRKRFKRGDVIFKEGDSSHVAYLIEKGQFQLSVYSQQKTLVKKANRGSFMSRFTFSFEDRSPDDRPSHTFNSMTYGGSYAQLPENKLPLQPDHEFLAMLQRDDYLFGESSCLNNYPQSCTVEAASDDCQVIEVGRNILQMLMRDRVCRELLESLYRERALGNDLKRLDYFSDLAENERELSRLIRGLKQEAQLIKVRPGQVIARLGSQADYQDFVRIGFVRVEKRAVNGDVYVERYLGPGSIFGDQAVLSSIDEIYSELSPAHKTRVDAIGRGRHVANYQSMDHVELLRIPKASLAKIYGEYRIVARKMRLKLKELLDEQALMDSKNPLQSEKLTPFLDQGLANARSLLVIDLQKCTRCDECTKACAQAHDGVTRMIREGVRYDRFLITSSCRSCMDPYCMLGCPVDAIHRSPDLTMKIESWCIGCGLCSNNCPYGNINMHGLVDRGSRSKTVATDDPVIVNSQGKAVIRVQATICDLCHETPSQSPSCVYACPHDAAHRVSGEKLLDWVHAD